MCVCVLKKIQLLKVHFFPRISLVVVAVVLQRSQLAEGCFSVNQNKCSSQLYLDFDAFSEADSKVTQLTFQEANGDGNLGPVLFVARKGYLGVQVPQWPLRNSLSLFGLGKGVWGRF